jgi:sugar O-acyltransferase (sialic acid O-acetyltransferase NeuD family)
MNNKLIIFGNGEIAEQAFYYFSKQSEHKIFAFVADNPKEEKFMNLPLISIEDVENNFSNGEYLVHVAISYRNLNKNRQDKFKFFENKNYDFASFISEKSSIMTNKKNLGRNLFILEEQSIQTGVKIGDNVMIWSNNHIGHNTVIQSHVYISSNVTISGNCEIGKRCFFGVNSCTADFVKIGDDCFITMGSVINTNLKNNCTTLNKSTLIYDSDSRVNRILKKKYFENSQ